MDFFESAIKTILEDQGLWVMSSFKVELTKDEKAQIGRPTIPRPEIDLIAFDFAKNTVTAWEVKSFLDSGGVKIKELEERFEIPSGRYKLFTCQNYRDVVFARLKKQLIASNRISKSTLINLGLAAGNVARNRSEELRLYLKRCNFEFLSPEEIKANVRNFANKGYENDPTILAAKILLK
ncbi:MAG: hypothetical protein AAF429_13845 [Pseudomonadota bacterium]